MQALSRVLLRALLGAVLTPAAAAFAAYARALPWAFLASHPLEALATLAMYPSDSDFATASYWAWDDVRRAYLILVPLGALLGVASGALLPRRAASRHVLGRMLLFGVIAMAAFAATSTVLVLALGGRLWFWDEILRIHRVSLAFVFVYAAAWHGICGLIAYQWHLHRPAIHAA